MNAFLNQISGKIFEGFGIHFLADNSKIVVPSFSLQRQRPHLSSPCSIFIGPPLCSKKVDQFRNYTSANEYYDRVKRTYLDMHTNQTVSFVEEKMDRWCKFDHSQMTIMEGLDLLNTLVDESDPDSGLPNIAHAFQTAEQIRESRPEPEYDWFHLTGLVHDLGKVLATWGEPQYAVTGDTFVVSQCRDCSC